MVRRDRCFRRPSYAHGRFPGLARPRKRSRHTGAGNGMNDIIVCSHRGSDWRGGLTASRDGRYSSPALSRARPSLRISWHGTGGPCSVQDQPVALYCLIRTHVHKHGFLRLLVELNSVLPPFALFDPVDAFGSGGLSMPRGRQPNSRSPTSKSCCRRCRRRCAGRRRKRRWLSHCAYALQVGAIPRPSLSPTNARSCRGCR